MERIKNCYGIYSLSSGKNKLNNIPKKHLCLVNDFCELLYSRLHRRKNPYKTYTGTFCKKYSDVISHSEIVDSINSFVKNGIFTKNELDQLGLDHDFVEWRKKREDV